MRRFRGTQSAGPCVDGGVARRSKMTGFSLFTRHTQRTQKVMRSTSLKAGAKDNMRIMAALWRQLPCRHKQRWNREAAKGPSKLFIDVSKRDTTFNVVMRVLARGDGALLNAGDDRFTAMIAKRTAEALSPKQAKMMFQRMNVDCTNLLIRGKSENMTASQEKKYKGFERMMMPDMKLFNSFTDMQHAVAPTQVSAFVNFHKMRATYYVPASVDHSLHATFSSLTPENKDRFSPISKEEAPAFETFCAGKCILLDPERFDILSLFGEFRGITRMKRAPNQTEMMLYRSLAAADRVRDGLYHKAHRILQRTRHGRSSDCGSYITSTSSAVTVPPQAYGVVGGTLSDIDVARMLADTRRNQSVYDDVLLRAAILRPAAQQKVLQPYDIRKTVAEVEQARRQFTWKSYGKDSVTMVQQQHRQSTARASKPVTTTTTIHARKAAVAMRAKKAARKSSRPTAKVTAAKVTAAKVPRLVAKGTAAVAQERAAKQTPKIAVKTAVKAAVKAPTSKAVKVATVAAAKPKKLKLSPKLTASKRGNKKTAPKARQSLTASASASRKTKKAKKEPEEAEDAVAEPIPDSVVAAAEAAKTTAKAKTRAPKMARTTRAAKAAKKRTAPPVTYEADDSATQKMETDLLAGDDGIADNEEDDFDYAPLAVQAAPVAEKKAAAKSKVKQVAKPKATATVRAGRAGAAKRRIRSMADILKGAKQPIVLTSHVAPTKKGKTSSSKGQHAPAESETVKLLRKQLAGFM